MQHSSAPFDKEAGKYDSIFSRTRLGQYLRSVVWQRYDVAFRGCERILEIGCGTGEDAIYLARNGHHVVATDASMSMLQVAKEKAACAGCIDKITFRRISMENLGRELGGEQFEGVCSNFGAVNCTPQLDKIVSEIAPLVHSRAPLVWVVMGRHVPWEWIWFLVRGERRKAFRRYEIGGAIWRGLRILYPTPKELQRVLNPYFAPARCTGLGIALPPTFASAWLDRSPRVFKALVAIERIAQRWPLLAALSDHYIVEARRLQERTDDW